MKGLFDIQKDNLSCADYILTRLSTLKDVLFESNPNSGDCGDEAQCNCCYYDTTDRLAARLNECASVIDGIYRGLYGDDQCKEAVMSR